MLLPLLLCVFMLYSDGASLGDVSVVGAAWAVAGLVAVNAVGAWAGTGLALRLARRGPRGARRAAMVFKMLTGLLVGLTAAAVFKAGWPAAVYELLDARWILLDDLLLLTPVLLMVLTQMCCKYRYEVARRAGTMTLGLGGYLVLRLRLEVGLVLGPWLVLMLVTDVADLTFEDSPAVMRYGQAISLGALGLIVILSPLIISWIWGTSPLPEGPLRDRLEAFCRRNSFRCTGLRVWHTQRHLANAGVVGPTPLLRYVLLSDMLLEHFPDDEVEAVLAHEVGHVRHHHMLFYVIFAVSFMLYYYNALYLLDAAHIVRMPTSAQAGGPLDTALMLGFAVIYWGVGFGLISRRMEQQADIYAARHTENPEAFVAALERLAAMDYMPRGSSHWRHFSIDRRVRFLRALLAEGETADAFLRRLTHVKWAFLLATLAALGNMYLAGMKIF